MRTGGTPRWSATLVAGLVGAGVMVLTLAGGPHHAAALVRSVPGATATAMHAVDARGLPLVHESGHPSTHAVTVDATTVTRWLAMAALALFVAVVGRRPSRLLFCGPLRSRAPPARH